MNALTISLPDSIHNQLQRLADQEGISIDQLAASALTEKIAALMSPNYLSQRAKQGNRAQFEQALAKVKGSEPEQRDRLL